MFFSVLQPPYYPFFDRLFFTVAGIVGSAIVLKYAHGQQEILAGGVIGLVSSIIVLLVCVAIFVIAVVALAIRTGRVRGRTGARIENCYLNKVVFTKLKCIYR